MRLHQNDAAIQEFGSLAKDWRSNRDKLSAAYNVVTPQESILENRKALEDLRHRPEFASTELAIKAFLVFILSGLLLLKLFEPASVRLYLSDVLQQEFDRYLAGTFDPLLPPTERSSSKTYTMSPQRLHGFLVGIWIPARQLEAQQADARARTSSATLSLDLLERMKDRINVELTQVSSEVQHVCTTADEANRSLTELHSAIATFGSDLAYFRSEMDRMVTVGNGLDQKSQVEFEMKRLEYRSNLQVKAVDAERALNELKEQLPFETERFKRASAALKQVEDKLHQKESELAEAQDHIRAVRDQLLSATGQQAHSLLLPAQPSATVT